MSYRWENFERDENAVRASRRFRHHVRTNWNPKGRIHREPCVFCGCLAEAHHVDYSRPFLVSWLCFSHHRQVEAGTIKLYRKHLFNYESLVIERKGAQKTLEVSRNGDTH